MFLFDWVPVLEVLVRSLLFSLFHLLPCLALPLPLPPNKTPTKLRKKWGGTLSHHARAKLGNEWVCCTATYHPKPPRVIIPTSSTRTSSHNNAERESRKQIYYIYLKCSIYVPYFRWMSEQRRNGWREEKKKKGKRKVESFVFTFLYTIPGVRQEGAELWSGMSKRKKVQLTNQRMRREERKKRSNTHAQGEKK